MVEKQELRQWVWDELTRTRQAGFPMPVHGRIPSFVGAPSAAAALRGLPEWQAARAIKVNPDAPQHPVRLMPPLRELRELRQRQERR